MNKQKLSEILHRKSVISIIVLFISIRVFIPLINGYITLLGKCFEKQYQVFEIHNLLDCIKTMTNNKIIALIYTTIVLISILSIYTIYFTKKQMKVEKEGINFKKKNGTYGTAKFTIPEEIDILEIGEEEQIPGIVLGRSIDTNEIITLPDSCQKINRNVMIWGASRFWKID